MMADARVDVSLSATCHSMRRQQQEKGLYHDTLESLVDSLNALLDEKNILERQITSSSSPFEDGAKFGSGSGKSLTSLSIERCVLCVPFLVLFLFTHTFPCLFLFRSSFDASSIFFLYL